MNKIKPSRVHIEAARLIAEINGLIKILEDTEKKRHKLYQSRIRKLRHWTFYVVNELHICFNSIFFVHFFGQVTKGFTFKEADRTSVLLDLLEKMRFWDKYNKAVKISPLNDYVKKSQIKTVHDLRNRFAHPKILDVYGGISLEDELAGYKAIVDVREGIEKFMVKYPMSDF